jgi:two-component system, OmpR family, phosphate regulon sensor histidine kinase PhoR
MTKRAGRAPLKLVSLIVGVVVVPLLTLSWLGWRLLEQDRALERQQVQQRVSRGADVVVATLQRAVEESERTLAIESQSSPDDAVVVTFHEDSIDIVPRRAVAYLPIVPALPEAHPNVFAEGEALEMRAGEYAAATAVFRRLTTSSDRSVRAGALVRLGRTLRKSGRFDEAVATYARLSDMDDVAVGGVPASLAAAYARCRLFEEQRRTAELEGEVEAFERSLQSGRWTLAAPVYALYSSDVSNWHGDSRTAPRLSETMAKAVAALWSRMRSVSRESLDSPERESMEVDGVTLTVLLQSSGAVSRALIATSSFVESHWLTVVRPLTAAHHVAVELRNARGRDLVRTAPAASAIGITRLAAETGLPWTVVVTTLEPPPESRDFAQRRQWLVAGLVVLAFLAIAAISLIIRSVARELAVAQQQSDFVAAVSHEFRTPLTSLRQFTEMLREQPSLDENRRRIAYDAQARATDRLARLVESLLDFGRMESGLRAYQFERQDAAAFTSQVVDDFRAEPDAVGRNIAFSHESTADVEIDHEAMARALRNVLDNAVKYSSPPAPVEVFLARRNGHAVITVRDHGIGIPADEQTKIFTKFHRGEEARFRGIKGTGIGLAMVDEIVRAHHGRIDVDSEPGAGSVFTIAVPIISRSPVHNLAEV